MDGSNNAHVSLLVELAWSGELLNRAPAWGDNWLRRARGGRWISELHSSYPAGHPAGLDAGLLLFVSHCKSGKMVKEEIGERRRCAILGQRMASFK